MGTVADLRPIAFMHVPKSAGNSLLYAMKAALNDRPHFVGMDRVLIGSSYDPADMPPGARNSLCDPSSVKLRDSALAIGHIALSTFKGALPSARLVTVVREPISRLLSLRVFWRRIDDDFLKPWGPLQTRRVTAGRLPLVDFLRSEECAIQTDNILVRMLLWPNENIPEDTFISEDRDAEILDLALKRLSDFEFVDFLENKKWEDNIGSFIGRKLTINKLNITRPMPADRLCHFEGEMNEAAWGLLKKCTRLDDAIWKSVVLRRDPSADPDLIRLETVARTVARHSILLRGMAESSEAPTA